LKKLILFFIKKIIKNKKARKKERKKEKSQFIGQFKITPCLTCAYYDWLIAIKFYNWELTGS
jgi:hypothetical protein